MSLPRAAIHLRLGRPHELELASAIDDDAGQLFTEFGIDFEIAPDHPYVIAERADWARAAAADRLWFALSQSDEPVGFFACDFVDGEPYLEQLSVRRRHMRRGIGAFMLAHAIEWSRPGPLWLTTSPASAARAGGERAVAASRAEAPRAKFSPRAVCEAALGPPRVDGDDPAAGP